MTVGELVKQLQRFDPKLEVLCYTEDPELQAKGHLFRLLAIVSVDTAEGEKVHGDDQVPTMKLGRTPYSQKFVSIDVTCDF